MTQLNLFSQLDFSDTDISPQVIDNTICTDLMVIEQPKKQKVKTVIPSSSTVYLLPAPQPKMPDSTNDWSYQHGYHMTNADQNRVKRLAKKLIKSAISLDKKIDKWRAPRVTNTNKRIREWEHNMDRANNAEWLADKYRAIAEYITNESKLPKALYSLTKVSDIEEVLNDTTGKFGKLTDVFKALGNRNAGQPSKEEIIRRKELSIGKINSFFPTPDILIERMLQFVNIERGTYILEPSAGRGDIAQYVSNKHPEAVVQCVEWSHSLREILDMKDLKVIGDDILTLEKDLYGKTFDVVLMNPPFEKGQDAQHIMHVFEHFLKPGGVLVSITSASTTFRKDEVYEEFREFLLENEAQDFPLPDKSFKNSDVSTGVATRMVIVSKADTNGVRNVIKEEDAELHVEYREGQWVRNIKTGEYASVMMKTRTDLLEPEHSYHVELTETMNDLMGKGTRRKFTWHVSDMTLEAPIQPVKITIAQLRVMSYMRAIAAYKSTCNLFKLGYMGDDRAMLYDQALMIAYNKADAVTAVKYIDETYEWSSWVNINDIFGNYSSRTQQDCFNDLVERAYLLQVGEYFSITEIGAEYAGLKYSEVSDAINQDKYAICGETAIVLVGDPQLDKRIYNKGNRNLPTTPAVIHGIRPRSDKVINTIQLVASGQIENPKDVMKAAFGLFPEGDNIFNMIASALDGVVMVEEMIAERMKKHYLNEDMMARLFNSLMLYKPGHTLVERLLKAHTKEMLDRVESGITRQSLLNRITDAELLHVMSQVTLATPMKYEGYLVYVELFHRCCPDLVHKIWNDDFKRPTERLRVRSIADEIEDMKDKYEIKRGKYDPKLPTRILENILGEKNYKAYLKKRDSFVQSLA